MPRILVVDDSPLVLAPVGQILREEGYLVTSTNDGADALCLLGTRPPHDLLLLDLRMPGFDGFDVLRALGPAAPPVVVMTGDTEGLRVHPDSHVVRVLRKPFGPDELLGAVRSALDGPAAAAGSPSAADDGRGG